MSNRKELFCDLENKFKQWLTQRGVASAANHYAAQIRGLGAPIQPHTTAGAPWFGLIELLTGQRPTVDIFEVSGIEEFSKNYGAAISLVSFDKKIKEQIRLLYPSCPVFDEIYSFLYSDETGARGDGGHTRCALVRYNQFLSELESKVIDNSLEKVNISDKPLQLIYYGAPGTGKSFRTNELVNNCSDTIRTTFHPDSDYASFVGCYKPAMRKRPRTTFLVSGTGFKVEKGPAEPAVEDYIAYDFVPQAFAKAYVQAWEKMAVATTGGKPEPQFLVIEEINRGNCAQIFGDLFQLLDRDGNGFSKYPIDPSADFAKHLRECFRGEYVSGDGTNSANIVSGLDEKTKAKVLTSGKPGVTWDDVVEGRKLVLPPNLFIWATMNTSDQSLFPMDSAFKRRWDWEYIPIRNHPEEDYRIEIGNELYPWWPFVSEINKRILSATDSEDKKLGYFFVKAEKNSDGRNVIDAGKFLNKVVFYLWNDVFKNSEPEKAFKFDRPDGKKDIAAFQDFFKEEDGSRDEEMLKAFLKGLGVEAQTGEDAENMPAAQPASSPADAAPAAPAAPESSPAMIG